MELYGFPIKREKMHLRDFLEFILREYGEQENPLSFFTQFCILINTDLNITSIFIFNFMSVRLPRLIWFWHSETHSLHTSPSSRQLELRLPFHWATFLRLKDLDGPSWVLLWLPHREIFLSSSSADDCLSGCVSRRVTTEEIGKEWSARRAAEIGQSEACGRWWLQKLGKVMHVPLYSSLFFFFFVAMSSILVFY